MKPTKQDQFFRKKNAQSSNLLIFAVFVTSISWSSIEFRIKANLEKKHKIQFREYFFWKVVLAKSQGLARAWWWSNIYMKTINPWPLNRKNGVL